MLHLEIITPDSTVFDGNVEWVTLPTGDGEITVLQHHLPIITTLAPGTAIVKTDEGEMAFAVSRGVVEIDGKGMRLLSDIADRADALEEAAVEKAQQDAEKLMNEKREDAEAFAEATAIFERELARLKTVRRYRSGRAFRTPASS
jgi:F-type H+-transporting ATPase subunit epsilon